MHIQKYENSKNELREAGREWGASGRGGNTETLARAGNPGWLKWGFTCRRPLKVGFKESGDMCKVMLEKKKIWLVDSVRGQTSKVGSRQLAKAEAECGDSRG